MKYKLGFECEMKWQEMDGTADRVRHCKACHKDIHNVSALSRAEADAFIETQKSCGRELCISQMVRDGKTSFADDADRRLSKQRSGIESLLLAAAIALPLAMLTPATATYDFLCVTPAGYLLDLDDYSPKGKILGELLVKAATDYTPPRGENYGVINGGVDLF
jgi:hypothetical protein